ncbi:uncharacterized protein [Ptychodera flava]|uniref:uncharacterized protein n=1 Tax=Ptychodera flava TaxID=63121 RepID=UPI003969D881
MVQKNGDIGLQVNLFHGTDEQSVTKICRQNFDFRVAGKNATLFGQGTYFARDASYSDCYSSDDDHGQRHMFLAYVLVGRYTVGQRSYKRPPEINTLTGELYDSCVNRQNDPTVFVIFDREQCYPAYLINFTKLNENRGPPFAANQLRSQVSTAAPPQHTAVTYNLSSGLNTDRWIPHTVSSTSTANLASPTTYVTSSSTRPNLSSPSSQYPTNSRSTSTSSRSEAISTRQTDYYPRAPFSADQTYSSPSPNPARTVNSASGVSTSDAAKSGGSLSSYSASVDMSGAYFNAMYSSENARAQDAIRFTQAASERASSGARASFMNRSNSASVRQEEKKKCVVM